MTSADELSDDAHDELLRLGATRVHIMGGQAAVSAGVQAELEALLGLG